MFLGNNGERGKGEKERGERKKRGDKAWRQRRAESCTRANPVYLARNFQSQLSQEKGPRAMKSCSAGTHLAQFKLPCGISLLAIRSLFLSLSPFPFPSPLRANPLILFYNRVTVFAIRMSDHSGFSLLSLVVKRFERQ